MKLEITNKLTCHDLPSDLKQAVKTRLTFQNPVWVDLEERLLDKAFDQEASLILDRVLQLEEQGLQEEIDHQG